MAIRFHPYRQMLDPEVPFMRGVIEKSFQDHDARVRKEALKMKDTYRGAAMMMKNQIDLLIAKQYKKFEKKERKARKGKW